MDLPGLKPGLTGLARRIVSPADTAEALGSGDVPVFGTPALIALMERAPPSPQPPARCPQT